VEVVQPNFGIRIRMLRLDRDWSQLDLAEACHISEDHVNNIERGKSWVSKEVIQDLADGLGVSQKALFDYSMNEEFVKNGGLSRRASRKPAKLIVRNRG
jgi:transcriptional regulator with XRE-family HTH domain